MIGFDYYENRTNCPTGRFIASNIHLGPLRIYVTCNSHPESLEAWKELVWIRKREFKVDFSLDFGKWAHQLVFDGGMRHQMVDKAEIKRMLSQRDKWHPEWEGYRQEALNKMAQED